MFEACNRLVGIYKTQDCTKSVTVDNVLPAESQENPESQVDPESQENPENQENLPPSNLNNIFDNVNAIDVS